MTETNLAEKFEQESFDTTSNSDNGLFENSMIQVANEIQGAYKNLISTMPANDNNPENPKDPSSANKTKEWLKEWIDLDSKVAECGKMIREKGLTPEEQEKRFQKAFSVSADYLRYELEIANVFNILPAIRGVRGIKDGEYTKCRYITDVLGIPYKRAWKIAKLTPESVEKAIQYGAEYKELPTRRLAILLTRFEDFRELKKIKEEEKISRLAERKAKKEAAEEASIQRGIDDFNAIQNPLPNVGPNDTYNIVYADPSEKSLNELKTYIIPASENSVLFMWSPANKLEERLDLMKTWGFFYKENAVWDRMDSTHTGQYFSNQHELLLVGVKGTGLTPRSKEKSICRIPLKEGETKPEYYTELIKTMYPGQPWLDVMATINAGKEV